MKKACLPKYKRQSGGVPFVITERDIEIMRAVNRYRYLKTSQIKRLLFPENKAIDSARRRLKYLFHNKFLGRVTPFVRIGEGAEETAYFLDKAGIELLQDSGEEIHFLQKQGGQVRHRFLSHALDISEFRLNLELAIQSHPVISLQRFTADFEMKEHTKKAIGKKIYKLYDEAIHPVNKKRYVVYPDALIILRGKGEYEKFQRLYFIEIDRGTETLSRIRDKVIGYSLYLKQKIFTKFGKFSAFKVLFQTNSEKRAENIRNALVNLEGTELIWITDVSRISDDTLLSAPVWEDHEMKEKTILKG